MCDYRYKRHLVGKKDPVLKELIELCEQAFINSVLSFNCVLMEAGSIYCDVFVARLFIYKNKEGEQTELYRFDIYPDGTDEKKLEKIKLPKLSDFYRMTVNKRTITPFADKNGGKITASGDYKVGLWAKYGDMEIPSMEGMVSCFNVKRLEEGFDNQLEILLAPTDFVPKRF